MTYICRGGRLQSRCDQIRLPDDCTIGYIISKLMLLANFHSLSFETLCKTGLKTRFFPCIPVFVKIEELVHSAFLSDYLLKVQLTKISTFHSHLEGLWLLKEKKLTEHVSICSELSDGKWFNLVIYGDHCSLLLGTSSQTICKANHGSILNDVTLECLMSGNLMLLC